MVNKQSGNTGDATTAAQTVTITATDSNTTASDKAPLLRSPLDNIGH